MLRRMHRKYRPRHYADRIIRARQLMPDAAIGADVMVGFPGETEEEFEQSRSFIENLPFTYLHVFTYSERPGTPAAEAGNAIPIPIRKRRNKILRDLAAQKHLEFRRSMVGRKLSVVTLGDGNFALSSNYLKVELSEPQSANLLLDVQIEGVTENNLRQASLLTILA